MYDKIKKKPDTIPISLTANRKLLKANPPLTSVTGDNHGVQCEGVIKKQILSKYIKRLPRWPSGCNCDCRARGLGFDSRVGQSITGLYSVFRKFLSGSTESGNVPGIWQ
uniref:SFRICE_029421 n=1 Tax=Spodoptera frugiperda TaxID=7108 RepID=A0A2H1VCE9_SPOFR